MGLALAYGFIVGDFWKDGGELIENPWGVSLFDVYVGFFFFIGWIACHESCPGIILAWAVAICVGGNRGRRIYAILALCKAKVMPRFFMGEDKSSCSTEVKEA